MKHDHPGRTDHAAPSMSSMDVPARGLAIGQQAGALLRWTVRLPGNRALHIAIARFPSYNNPRRSRPERADVGKHFLSMAEFSKIISLGPSCETAYQIRQIVEQEEAYVFDWIIASAASVARAISMDFSELVQPKYLRLCHREGQVFVADALTRIEFHHDFRNDEAFMETLPDVQQKYSFLKNRTRELLGSAKTLLFIHQNGTRDDAYHLHAALAERFPTLNFELLELACGGEPGLHRDGRIVFASIPGHGSTWQERTPQWSALLDDLLAKSYGRTLKRRDPATWDPVPLRA